MMSKRFVPDPTRRRAPLKGINHSIEAEMLEHNENAGKVQKKLGKLGAKVQKKVGKLRSKLRGA